MIPTHIIMHHSLTADSGTVSWQAIRRYHTQTLGWDDVGYHFCVELVNKEFEIMLGRMPHVMGAHCKDGGMNRKALGVCFVGNFDMAPPSICQWISGVKLCASICEVLSMDVSHVRAHRDYANKTCPGRMFDMGRFRMDIGSEMRR